MTPELIIWPMVLLALVTLYLYVPMSRARRAAVASGKVKPSEFKLNKSEPEESRIFINAISNQYETPILFYAVCLSAYVTGNAGPVMIVLAWLYLIAKCIHVFVHVTTNRLRLRRPIFMVAYFLLAIMWLVLAGHLLKLY